MDYSEARAAFFAPREGEVAALDWSTPARRLRDAIEPLATVCFWSEPAYDAYAARGLDFLGGYVWGRASALGDADPAVAAATFGVFEPGLISDVLAGARETCSLADVRAAKEEGSAAALRTVLGDPEQAEGLAEAVAALRGAAEAASPVGRPLFAGLAGLAWPEDGWAALWHACATLREHRGDAHLAVLVAHAVDGLEANVLTERWVGWGPLDYTGSRAWSPEAMAAATGALEERGLLDGDGLSEAGRTLRADIETQTDAAEQGVVDALSVASSGSFDDLVARLDGWAAQVVEHGWFPPDPYKRASG